MSKEQKYETECCAEVKVNNSEIGELKWPVEGNTADRQMSDYGRPLIVGQVNITVGNLR